MLKVFLADDDPDDRLFFEDALAALKIQTNYLSFKNGQELLIQLNEHPDELPDLIFLDLNMPIMSGLECLETIRAKYKMSELVIAIYSTSSSQKDIEDTFLKGANIYINKPVSFKDLKSVLSKVIKINWQYANSNLNKENFLLKL